MTSKKETKNNPKAKTNIGLYVGSVIVFILIFISFIILPGMVQGAGRGVPVFGKWGKKTVKYEADSFFNQALSYYGNQIKESGQNYNEYIMQIMTRQAFQKAFDETIRRYAFIVFVESTGYTVSENNVDRKMIPNFYDATGKYNEKIYRDTPDSKKASMRKNYEEENLFMRFLKDYFPKEIAGSEDGICFAFGISDNEVDFMNKMNSTTKNFDVAVFNTNEIPDSQAASFAKDNSQLFEQFFFKAISVESESAAKKILSQIKSQDATFDDSLSEYSKNYYTPTTGSGELKNKYKYQIEETLYKKEDFSKISSLKIDECSPVIRTKTGYTIYKCYGNPVKMDIADFDTMETVKSYLKTNEKGRIQDYFLNTANALLAEAKNQGFDKACESFNVTKKSVYNYILNYDDSNALDIASCDVDELSSVSKNEDFLKTVFSLKENEISKPIVLENAIVLVKCNADTEKTDRKIEKIDCQNTYFNQDYSTIYKSILDSKKMKNYFDETYTKYFTSTEK